MKKCVLAFIALLGASSLASAAPPAINFAAGMGWPGFNSTQVDNTSFAGIAISGFVYITPFSSTTYHQDKGYLWLRNNPGDHGLGYCDSSEGTSCGAINTTGGGDYNELSNNKKNEIIRLTLPTGKMWTDIQVSSLDDGGTNGDETGTFYWSNTDKPDLQNNSTSFINFSHDGLGWNASTVEGSIFNYLVAHGFDVNAKYLFFRAGEFNGLGTSTNGTNNDFLVWGVNVTTPVPEPETYAMLLAGLGLLGFMAKRRKLKEVTAA